VLRYRAACDHSLMYEISSSCFIQLHQLQSLVRPSIFHSISPLFIRLSYRWLPMHYLNVAGKRN